MFVFLAVNILAKVAGRSATSQFAQSFAPGQELQGLLATFLKSRWDVMAAVDFASVEVWTKGGLVTFCLLFVMELKTRRVHFAGSTTSPDEASIKPIARELTNHEDGFLQGKRYLIMDHDKKFRESFRAFPSNENVEPVLLPPRSPNMNAHLERFFGSLKSECLDRLILSGERALRNAIDQYLVSCLPIGRT